MRGYKCPDCGKGKLEERVHYGRGIRWWVCPRCSTSFYEHEDNPGIIIEEIGNAWDSARVDDVLDATCICNNCGCLYNDDRGHGLQLFREFDLSTGDFENFRGCYNCKTDAYLMDVNVTDRIRSYGIKPVSMRGGSR